jgi:hypothetical protein
LDRPEQYTAVRTRWGLKTSVLRNHGLRDKFPAKADLCDSSGKPSNDFKAGIGEKRATFRPIGGTVTSEERFTRIENVVLSITETQVRQQLDISKQHDGIKDLIILNRSFLESMQQMTDNVHRLTADQADLRQMVQALITTVERFIQTLQHPNGN